MVEFIQIGDVDDIARGAGGDDDAKTERAATKARLKVLGIAPITPYTSPLMTTAQPVNRKWRKEAKAAGQLYYFSPHPCIRGHTSRRLTSNGKCCACHDVYKSKNPDKMRKYSRDSHQRARDREKKSKQDAMLHTDLTREQ